MRTGGIDSSQIQAMIAQLHAAATRPAATPPAVQTEKVAEKPDFTNALKGALDAVQAARTRPKA